MKSKVFAFEFGRSYVTERSNTLDWIGRRCSTRTGEMDVLEVRFEDGITFEIFRVGGI